MPQNRFVLVAQALLDQHPGLGAVQTYLIGEGFYLHRIRRRWRLFGRPVVVLYRRRITAAVALGFMRSRVSVTLFRLITTEGGLRFASIVGKEVVPADRLLETVRDLIEGPCPGPVLNHNQPTDGQRLPALQGGCHATR